MKKNLFAALASLKVLAPKLASGKTVLINLFNSCKLCNQIKLQSFFFDLIMLI